MKEVLTELNKTPGLLGSAVLAHDGLLIASHASTALQDQEMWQHALRAFQGFAALAQACGCGDALSASLEWEQGKVVAKSIPQGVLLAAADGACALGPVQIAVEQAAAAIAAAGVEEQHAAP
jgi:predicted regulator of Ras-like GTPase activity (Roadblock/LC7/MglB family)